MGQLHALHFDQFWSVYVTLGLPCGYAYRRLGGRRWYLNACVIPACWFLLLFRWSFLYIGLFLGIGVTSSYVGWVLAREASKGRLLYVHTTAPQRNGGLILLVVLSMVASIRIVETSAVLAWDVERAAAATGLGFLYTMQLCIHGACATTLLASLRVWVPRCHYLTVSSLLHIVVASIVLFGKVEEWGERFERSLLVLCILVALYANVVSSASSSIFLRLIDFSQKME